MKQKELVTKLVTKRLLSTKNKYHLLLKNLDEHRYWNYGTNQYVLLRHCSLHLSLRIPQSASTDSTISDLLTIPDFSAITDS